MCKFFVCINCKRENFISECLEEVVIMEYVNVEEKNNPSVYECKFCQTRNEIKGKQ